MSSSPRPEVAPPTAAPKVRVDAAADSGQVAGAGENRSPAGAEVRAARGERWIFDPRERARREAGLRNAANPPRRRRTYRKGIR